MLAKPMTQVWSLEPTRQERTDFSDLFFELETYMHQYTHVHLSKTLWFWTSFFHKLQICGVVPSFCSFCDPWLALILKYLRESSHGPVLPHGCGPQWGPQGDKECQQEASPSTCTPSSYGAWPGSYAALYPLNSVLRRVLKVTKKVGTYIHISEKRGSRGAEHVQAVMRRKLGSSPLSINMCHRTKHQEFLE